MKKIFVFLLAVLMLTGCKQQPVETSLPPEKEETTTVPTEPAPTGCYDPQQSTKALRAYKLSSSAQEQVVLVGGNPVLVSNQGHLQLLQGEDGLGAASAQMENAVLEGVHEITTYEDQLAYYVESSRQVIVLDALLREIQRITLPEDAQGIPVISLKNHTVFYCAEDRVCRIRMDTGIDSVLRSHSCQSQALVNSLFDGDILVLRMIDQRDQMHILHLNAEDGQIISQDAGVLELFTGGQYYYATRTDGMVRQQIVGSVQGQPQELTVDPRNKTFFSALSMQAMAVYEPEERTLSLIDLESGKEKAMLDTSGITEILDTVCDDTYFWILAANDQSERMLYRWDPAQSSVTDETVYLAPMRTPENPDLEGLAACAQQAKELGDQFGFEIRIWQDAMNVTDEHTFEAEYQVAAISGMLDSLRSALSMFPDGFLAQSHTKPVCIQLVRSVDGEKTGLQFWQEGVPYITLCSGSDIEREFLLSYGLVMDAHIIGHSRKFDKWDQMNPEGFAYAYDYRINDAREDLHFLEGEDPAFVHQDAMSFPNVDRSHVFYYAISWEGEGMFDTPILQKKLETVCRAIREAYGLEKSPETYPWEQYLHISLAYTK